jgi:hypothetical protein
MGVGVMDPVSPVGEIGLGVAPSGLLGERGLGVEGTAIPPGVSGVTGLGVTGPVRPPLGVEGEVVDGPAAALIHSVLAGAGEPEKR